MSKRGTRNGARYHDLPMRTCEGVWGGDPEFAVFFDAPLLTDGSGNTGGLVEVVGQSNDGEPVYGLTDAGRSIMAGMAMMRKAAHDTGRSVQLVYSEALAMEFGTGSPSSETILRRAMNTLSAWATYSWERRDRSDPDDERVGLTATLLLSLFFNRGES